MSNRCRNADCPYGASEENKKNCDCIYVCDGFEADPDNRADRIRRMTDEEMADEIYFLICNPPRGSVIHYLREEILP